MPHIHLHGAPKKKALNALRFNSSLNFIDTRYLNKLSTNLTIQRDEKSAQHKKNKQILKSDGK